MNKKAILSLFAAAAMATTAAQAETKKDNIFYIGAGLSAVNVSEMNAAGSELNEMSHMNVGTFIAGITDPSQYWGLEFRFQGSLGNGELNGSEFESTFINMGVFAKPQYKFDNGFKAYGLAGYSAVYTNYRRQPGYEGNREEDHVWQFGGGVSYSVTEHIDLFADYTRMLDKDGFNVDHMDYNYEIGGLTFGMIYDF